MDAVERYGCCDDWVTLNNASALLDELLTNAEPGPLTLYAWYQGEGALIRSTLEELNIMRLNLEKELDSE